MESPIRVLLIEDSAVISETIRDTLASDAKFLFDLTSVDCLKSGFDCLKTKQIDIIILDLTLPDSQGMDTFIKTHNEFPRVPVIILTGVDDETLAFQAVSHGAQDYLVKNQVNIPLISRSIAYALERNRIEEDLRRARDELETRVSERTAQLIQANRKLQKEIEERQEAQTRLAQAEKMEVVGRLASGVAHEVRNPLAIILQSLEFLENRLYTDEKCVPVLKMMHEAIMRADNIITGLLDFSRISRLDISPHDLNGVIEGTLLLVKHQFDKYHIHLEKKYSPALQAVNIDKNRTEQVLVNVMMNAIDAMAGKGGTLTIRTFEEAREGRSLVVCEIDDTGGGIPDDIRNKIFDPFFTTKRDRGGTGLGLPIVRTIMDMHKGTIDLNNIPGGTRARITFPA